MVSAVTDQKEMTGLERGAAVRALAPDIEAARFERLAGFPVRAADRPGHDVLEAAEDRAAIAIVLAEAKAVPRLDVGAAPRAAALVRSR